MATSNFLSEELPTGLFINLPNLRSLFVARNDPPERESSSGFELAFYLSGLFQVLSAPKLENATIDLRWLDGVEEGINLETQVAWDNVRRMLSGICRRKGSAMLPDIRIVLSAEINRMEHHVQAVITGLRELQDAGTVHVTFERHADVL